MAEERDRAREVAVQQAVGARIRALRQERGLSQDEFAARVGIHRTHPNKLENGKIDPRLSTLVRVADALGVSVGELLD